MKKIKIGEKFIGKENPCYIIAEAGINHNGDLNLAKRMVDVAKDAGVDAIKFQTFTAEEFINDENEMYKYETQGEKVEESMLKMFKRHEFTKKEWYEIFDYCLEQDITFLSTPQNVSNLELLLDIGITAIKIGSDDLTNLELLENYAQRGLPILISTGMAYMSEVDEAVREVKKYNEKVVIFHCVSSYPTEFEEVNLMAIETLQSAYPNEIIGFSDHTFGIDAPIAATAMGMKVYEKHFTLDQNMKGPDHRFSANPKQLKNIVLGIRNIEQAIGNGEISPSKSELEMRELSQRSIVAARNITKGEKLVKEDLIFKRPGTGIPPKNKKYLVGRKVISDIKKNEVIKLDKLG